MSTSTNTTNTTQTPLAQIHPSSSSNSGSGGEFMLLPCGGRTKSTRDILALLRQQVQGFPRTTFVTDNHFMGLFTPLLEEAKDLKQDAESTGKRINWGGYKTKYGTAMSAHNKRREENRGLRFLSPMPSHNCIQKFSYKLDGDKPVRVHKDNHDRKIVTVEQFVDFSNEWKDRQTIGESACLCHQFCNYIDSNTTFGTEFLDLCFEKCQHCQPRAKRSKRNGNPMDQSAFSLEQGAPTTTRNARNTTDSTVNQTSNTTNVNSHNASNANNNDTRIHVFNTTNVYWSNPLPDDDTQFAQFENRKLKQYIVDHGLPVPEITMQQFLDELAREAMNSSSDVASPSGTNRSP